METKPTNILICSTGSTPHAFKDHYKRGDLLEYYNYLVDLDGDIIYGKEWEPGDTIRIAYVGGIRPDNHSKHSVREDTRTDDQKFMMVWLLTDLISEYRINPNLIKVHSEFKKLTALEKLHGVKPELAGLTGFSYDQFKEELEMLVDLFDCPWIEDNNQGYISMN